MELVEEFLAYAIKLESEAAERFGQLANVMHSSGNSAVAKLFRQLSDYSRMHQAEAQARSGFRDIPKLSPTDFVWPDLEIPRRRRSGRPIRCSAGVRRWRLRCRRNSRACATTRRCWIRPTTRDQGAGEGFRRGGIRARRRAREVDRSPQGRAAAADRRLSVRRGEKLPRTGFGLSSPGSRGAFAGRFCMCLIF